MIAALWRLAKPLLLAIPGVGPALAFVTSPIGIAVAGLALFGGGYVTGHSSANQKAELAEVRRQLKASEIVVATREADMTLLNAMVVKADQAREAEATHRTNVEEQIRDYERTLAARPNLACRMDDADIRARRLRPPGR